MKKLLMTLIPVLLLFPLASALQVTDITFIPERVDGKYYLSKNSPFILILDFDDGQSVRTEWGVSEGGFSLYQYGGIPKVNGRFVCFFSDDPSNNCGPPIFLEADNYNLFIYAINEKMENVTLDSSDPRLGKVAVGDIVINSKINIDNQTVHVTSVPVGAIVDWMKYRVYTEDFVRIREGIFEVDEFDRYLLNITLPQGSYYLSMYTERGSERGGKVIPLSVGEAVPGESSYDVKATDIDLTGPDSILLKKGESFRKGNYKLTNTKNETVHNLSITVPSSLAKYITIELQNDSIQAGRSIYFTLDLHGIQSAIEIRTEAKVLSNSEQVGKIDIKADVSTEGKVISAQMIEITNPPNGIWTGDYLVGKTSKDFTIKNNGDSPAGNISYSASGNINRIVESLDHPTKIAAGSSGELNVTLSPTSAGRKTGRITIETDSGNAYIFADITFYSNMSPDISETQAGFDRLKDQLSDSQTAAYSDLISKISGSLSSANTFFENGNYPSAKRELDSAGTVMEILQSLSGTSPTSSYCGDGTCDDDEDEYNCPKDCTAEDNGNTSTPPQPQPSGDMTGIILIIILIVVAAVGIWFYFTRIRSSGWEDEMEEGY